MLHSVEMALSPIQSFLPRPFLQILDLDFLPPPQVIEQPSKSDHSDQYAHGFKLQTFSSVGVPTQSKVRPKLHDRFLICFPSPHCLEHAPNEVQADQVGHF